MVSDVPVLFEELFVFFIFEIVQLIDELVRDKTEYPHTDKSGPVTALIALGTIVKSASLLFLRYGCLYFAASYRTGCGRTRRGLCPSDELPFSANSAGTEPCTAPVPSRPPDRLTFT